MITLSQLKLYLRVDHNEEDELLLQLLDTAFAIVEKQIRRQLSEYNVAGGEIPKPIQHAAMLLVGHWYENREATSERKLEEVPLAVSYLLTPYKRFVGADGILPAPNIPDDPGGGILL